MRIPQRQAVALKLAAALLLVALCVTGCGPTRQPALAKRPTPTAPAPPLSHTTVLWSAETQLLALQAGDGRERWHVGGWTLPLPSGNGFIGFGPQAPVVDHGLLFATSYAEHAAVPTAYAIDPTDGTIRWQTSLAGCFGYPNTAPLAAGGVLYVAMTSHFSGGIPCGPTSWVFALRESDGAVLWRKSFDIPVFPSLALTDGVLVVLTFTEHPQLGGTYLTGLSAGDGSQLWQVQRTASQMALTTVAGVVVLTSTQRVDMTDQFTTYVEAFRAADGAQVWQTTLAVHYAGSVETIAGGLAYVHSDLGYLYALRIADGSTAWRFQTHVGAIGTPALMNGDLYFGSGPRVLVVDAASGTLVRTYELFDALPGTENATQYFYDWTQPVLAGGAIFAVVAVWGGHPTRPSGTLLALDQASGSVLWQKTSLPGYSAPVAMEMP